MFGNTAAYATYRFPLNFCAKELAWFFEIILAHIWDTRSETVNLYPLHYGILMFGVSFGH